MKRYVLAVVAAAFSTICTAQEITLVCKGWEPIYKRFEDGAINQGVTDNTFLVKLDSRKKTAAFRTQIGEIVTDLLIQDAWYSGTSAIGSSFFGKFIANVNLSVNRMTGETIISYTFPDKSGNVIFDGTCAPGKALF